METDPEQEVETKSKTMYIALENGSGPSSKWFVSTRFQGRSAAHHVKLLLPVPLKGQRLQSNIAGAVFCKGAKSAKTAFLVSLSPDECISVLPSVAKETCSFRRFKHPNNSMESIQGGSERERGRSPSPVTVVSNFWRGTNERFLLVLISLCFFRDRSIALYFRSEISFSRDLNRRLRS